MDRNTDKLPQRLLDINKEFIADVELKELNLSQKTLATPAIKTKWLMIYLEEKNMLKLLRDKKTELSEEYVTSHGKPGIPKIQTKLEIEKSSEIIAISAKIYEQALVTEYLENTLKIVGGYNFDISNAIKIVQIESV